MAAIVTQRFFTTIKGKQPRRRARSTALCVLLALLAVIASGCSNNAARGSRDLAARITRDSSAQKGSSPAPPPASEERRVYLDASLSMKGFVNSAQHTQFDKFVEAIGDALPGCQLYKYGQKKGETNPNNPSLTERSRFGRELHAQDFYDRLYNPDDKLIGQLADEEHPALSVLITDGVYSEPQGATSPPVVQAIQRWMDRGNTFGIFILKSKFDGPFYSETNRRMMNGFPPINERPFYAFVFSPTAKEFKELRDGLSHAFSQAEMTTLLFADDAVTCTPKLDQHLKGLYSFSSPPQAPYYWQMFDEKLFAQQNPAQVQYSVNCTIAPEYPVSELNFEASSEYYRWDKGQFKKAEKAPAGFDAVPASASSSSTLAVKFPKDTGSDYGFYYLRLIPSAKSLRQEIEDVSTPSDQTPSEADRTFRFRELIRPLATTHFKTHLAPQASPAIFVTVKNH
ncbi:MAG: hypothetical protein QOD00_3105 [Blastocatellia bacterium]|jgi:hypothetical protein|nr:hypothetical protein [Blastocatellia bacterium]